MSSKRKITPLGLERRVRAKREEEWDPELDLSDESEVDEKSDKEAEVAGEDGGSDEGDATSAGSNSMSEQGDAPKADFASISFGALVRAQASLPPAERKRKTGKPAASTAPSVTRKEVPKRDAKATKRAESLKRSSKHAPQEMSSKRAVSRRREIIADPRTKYRDPRFDPLTGKLDEAKVAKNYAFLDEYRDSEMTELRAQIKKTKDLNTKEELKRQLMSMESRKKAQRKKDEEATLLAEHCNKEKELVAQGKNPFYLKRSEQKKQLLMNRYASMSKSQVDKAIERKRKKVVGKEKKELASLERVPRRH